MKELIKGLIRVPSFERLGCTGKKEHSSLKNIFILDMKILKRDFYSVK